MEMTQEEKIEIVEAKLPVYRWKVRVLPAIDICTEKRPSRWVRFWQRFFLNWVWEELDV